MLYAVLFIAGQQFTRPSSTARSTVAAGQTARFGRTFNCTAPASNGPLNTKYDVAGILFPRNLINLSEFLITVLVQCS